MRNMALRETWCRSRALCEQVLELFALKVQKIAGLAAAVEQEEWTRQGCTVRCVLVVGAEGSLDIEGFASRNLDKFSLW